jgi:hypothetical protein
MRRPFFQGSRLKRPKRHFVPSAPPERRTEVFSGEKRWKEIHSLYDSGNTVDGWFLEKCTWSREIGDDPDNRDGIAVFVRFPPKVY